MYCRNKPKTPAWLLAEIEQNKANAPASEPAPSAAVPEQTAPASSPSIPNTKKVDNSQSPAPVAASTDPVPVPETETTDPVPVAKTESKPAAQQTRVNRAAKHKGVRRGRKRGAPKVPLWVTQEMAGKSNPTAANQTPVQTGATASPEPAQTKQISGKGGTAASSESITNCVIE